MAPQKTSLPLLTEADPHPCPWCQKAPDSPTQTDTLACSPFPVPSQSWAVGWSTISVQIHKCNCNSCIRPAQHEGQDLHVQLLIHSFLLHRMTIVALGFGFALPMASNQHAVSFSLQFPPLILSQHTPTVLASHSHTESRTLRRWDCSHKIYAITDDKYLISGPREFCTHFCEQVQLL